MSTQHDGFDSDKEFSFEKHDFERVRDLIYRRAGIALADSKQEMVYSRLARRLRVLGMTSFAQYLHFLDNDHSNPEWEEFTNALTTNLTSFFREAHHFPILAEHVKKVAKPVKVWCSAASTGEEPYSIAITLCEAFGSLTPPATIVATDIDTSVLETARKGVYPLERVEKLSHEQLKKYFLKGKGNREGFVKVRPELMKMIEFKPLNLLDAHWPIQGPFDAIFCRNVMIYFDKQTQSQILKKFVPLMKSDGLLFAGHSENFLYSTSELKLRGKTVYELNNGTLKSGNAQ